MRRTKRAVGHKAASRGQQPRRAVYARGFEGLFLRHQGQNARKAARQHGFAAARHAHHQHVVSTRSRDFQRAFGGMLAANLGQIQRGRGARKALLIAFL